MQVVDTGVYKWVEMMCGQKCSIICSTRTECDILCWTQTCVDAVWFGLVRLRVFVVFLLRKLFFLGQHCGTSCASDCRGCSGSLFVGSLFECLHLVMHGLSDKFFENEDEEVEEGSPNG